MSEEEIVSDSAVIARIVGSEFAVRWRGMPREQRREVLEILAGRSDEDSIRSAIIETTTGQRSLF